MADLRALRDIQESEVQKRGTEDQEITHLPLPQQEIDEPRRRLRKGDNHISGKIKRQKHAQSLDELTRLLL